MLTRRALAVTVIPIAVALLQPLAFAGSPSPLAVADAAAVLDPARITQRRLLAHVRFLASDQLEGRDSASRGNELATLYIASHFEQLGLEPVGSTPDGATGPRRFFQPFRLAATAFENVSLEVDGQPLRPGPDFAIFPWSGGGRATSELVFCGYGITAPEHDYDDYDGIDIKGKVVLVLRHEPRERERESWFEGRTHTRHARFDTKLENAIRHGAAGLVLVNDPIHCGGQRHFGSSGGRAISGLAGGANGDGDRPDDDGGPGIPFVFAGKRLVE